MEMRKIRRAAAMLYGALVFVAAAHVAVRGDDNPLGLPESIDPNRPGAVMLHGGGLVTDETFEKFLELAGGSEARIIFVPSAGYRVSSYADEGEFLEVVSTRYGTWSTLAEQGRVRDFQFLYTEDPTDADDEEFVAPLEQATGVWFSGGNQSRLNYCFVGEHPTLTKFQEKIRRVVERGGIVGGSSAGMAAMPQIMTLSEDRRMMSAPAVAVTAHGFGLLTKAVVEQHFDARGGRFERFFQLLRNSERLDELSGKQGASEEMVGLAVEEHTAVIARKDRLDVVGQGKAHVFLKQQAGRSINWQELRPGESARLKREAVRPSDDDIVLVHESEATGKVAAASE